MRGNSGAACLRFKHADMQGECPVQYQVDPVTGDDLFAENGVTRLQVRGNLNTRCVKGPGGGVVEHNYFRSCPVAIANGQQYVDITNNLLIDNGSAILLNNQGGPTYLENVNVSGNSIEGGSTKVGCMIYSARETYGDMGSKEFGPINYNHNLCITDGEQEVDGDAAVSYCRYCGTEEGISYRDADSTAIMSIPDVDLYQEISSNHVPDIDNNWYWDIQTESPNFGWFQTDRGSESGDEDGGGCTFEQWQAGSGCTGSIALAFDTNSTVDELEFDAWGCPVQPLDGALKAVIINGGRCAARFAETSMPLTALFDPDTGLLIVTADFPETTNLNQVRVWPDNSYSFLFWEGNNSSFSGDYNVSARNFVRVTARYLDATNEFVTLDDIAVAMPNPYCNGNVATVDLALGQMAGLGVDVIAGTATNDDIDGFAGNDVICGFGGDDVINSRGGDDWIDSGSGNDTVFGGAGDDQIYGGRGDDVIDGGGGADEIYGQADNDTLFGRTGNDTLDGGDGVDGISGGPGSDQIYTGSGATVGTGVFVSGGNGADTIFGGPDSDNLVGSSGADTIFGGDGNDVIAGGIGRDSLHGEDGDDDIRGQDSRDELFGDGGNDTLAGGAGNDDLDGGVGDDTCSGQAGERDTAVNCETEFQIP